MAPVRWTVTRPYPSVLADPLLSRLNGERFALSLDVALGTQALRGDKGNAA